MKIAYLGKIQLSDVDLSYLHEAQKLADITYVMEVCPRFLKGPAFNIDQIYQKSGIFKATDAYPEFQKYANFIDIDKFYVANTCGRLWQLKSFWTHFLLMLFLIRQQFNVIHLVWPPNIYEFILYIMRARMMLTVHDPFVHTAHDSFVVRLRRKMAFLLASRLVILNKTQRKELISYYKVSPDRVIDSRLSCYTYLNVVSPDTSSVPYGEKYILFAGRISPYKGIDTLLQAMDIVQEQCPDCKLILAGAGDYYFDVSSYISKNNIEIRNRYIPDDEMVALVRESAFMVCPYTDATQSGVIMSAFAFSKPVIVSDVGGLPEMVVDDLYGCVVRDCNVENLAQAIVAMWTAPEKVRLYSDNIKNDYINGQMSWKNVVINIQEQYKRMCQ